jgi:TonB family protein
VNRGDNLRGRRHLEERNESKSGTNYFLLLLLIVSTGFSIYLYLDNLTNLDQIETLRNSNRLLNTKVKENNLSLSTQHDSISDLERKLEIAEWEWNKRIKENNTLKEKINNLEEEINTLENTPEAPGNNTAINVLQKKLDDAIRKINVLERLLADKDIKINNLEVQVAQLISQIDVDPTTTPPVQIAGPEIPCEITPATVLKRPAPIYPKKALTRDIEGTVKLELDVSILGQVTNVRTVSSSSSMLTSAATKAAYKIKFQPSKDCNGNLLMQSGLLVSYKFKMN